MEPWVLGPPEAKSALTRVLRELMVYAPGVRAWPTTNTWMDRSSPRSTLISKLR